MKLFMVREYDRLKKGAVVEVSPHIGCVLARNDNFFGVPADAASMKLAEKRNAVDYRQLQRYAKALDVPATGETEELRAAILEAVAR